MQRDSSSLDELLDNPRIWRGHAGARAGAGLPSGHDRLDRHLPGGGWPRHALTEILTAQYGIGELELVIPALAKLSTDDPADPSEEPGWIAWIAPPFLPYAPALAARGIDLSHLLVVRPGSESDLLWSAEQALSSGTCAAVLLWPERLDDQDSRRLQLAAGKGRSWAVAFRPPEARQLPSAAALRVALEAGPSGVHVDVFKNRGGRPVRLDRLLPYPVR